MKPEEIPDKFISEFAERLLFRLESVHGGEENAISQKTYSKKYEKCTALIFCRAVNQLRSRPNPIEIGSGWSGYYYIIRQEEVEKTFHWLESKIIGAAQALQGMRELRDIREERQLSLL